MTVHTHASTDVIKFSIRFFYVTKIYARKIHETPISPVISDHGWRLILLRGKSPLSVLGTSHENHKPQKPVHSGPKRITETVGYRYNGRSFPVFGLNLVNRLLVTFNTQLVFTLEHPVSACVRVDRPALMDTLRCRMF